MLRESSELAFRRASCTKLFMVIGQGKTLANQLAAKISLNVDQFLTKQFASVTFLSPAWVQTCEPVVSPSSTVDVFRWSLHAAITPDCL